MIFRHKKHSIKLELLLSS